MDVFTISAKKIIFATAVILCLLALATHYYGTTDVADYADPAKYFAGKFSADLRTSHSLSYSLVLAPLLMFSNSFNILKLVSLASIILIILSVYYISGKRKSTLLLICLSPLIWYMSPWISPIPLASLFFLWGVFFIKKYSETEKKSYLAYSGILVGLAWVFWNTILFILPFLLVCFFYKKNINHFFIYLFFIIVGLIPLFIIDYIFYGFPGYSILKHFVANLVVISSGGIYGGIMSGISYIDYIIFILLVPIFSYRIFSRKSNLRTSIFLLLSFLFFFLNPQTRYLLIIYPLVILEMAGKLEKKQIRMQIIIFLILDILIISPYLIQIAYSTSSPDLETSIKNFGNWQITKVSDDQIILNDIKEIAAEYPSSIFLVGNKPDDYQLLAHLYWGAGVSEFVSIQDYSLFLENKTVLFEKKFMPTPRISDRRQIWIEGGISSNENDKTDYDSIEYAIGVGAPVDLKNFAVIKKYNLLYLSKRVNL